MAAAQEEKLYVAVPEKSKDGMSILRWTLRNAPKDVTIVIIHVYIFDKTIPTPLGGRVHPNIAYQGELTAYRREETAKAESKLDAYVRQCSKAQFKCDRFALGSDNITEGVLKLISIMEIKKMVMGAAADRYYSMSMVEPISNTAKSIMKKADPSCKIWFVCKGDLICTREADHGKLIKTLPLPCSPSLNNKAIAQEQYAYKHSKLSPETNFRESDARSSFMTDVDVAVCDDVDFDDVLSNLNLVVQKVKSTVSMEKQRMQIEIEYLTAQLNDKDKLLREANVHNMRLESRVKELEEKIALSTSSIDLLQSENIQLCLGEENLRLLELTTIEKMILEECCKGLGHSLAAIKVNLNINC